MKLRVLVTCPPMIKRVDQYSARFENIGLEYYTPEFDQTLSEETLVDLVAQYDIWIAGDDIISEGVLRSGRNGNLKKIVRWGVGTDNIDRDLAKKYGYDIPNTPGMFGEEVSDVAIGYLLMLNRKLGFIDRSVRNGIWCKPCGHSLRERKVAVLGYGNIGKSLCKKLDAFGLNVHVYDPYMDSNNVHNVSDSLSSVLTCADYLIVTCPRTKDTLNIINEDRLKMCNKGVHVINVARGGIVNEKDMIKMLEFGYVDGFASDVFDQEPIVDSPLLQLDNVILGSHNASNTEEAVDRTSHKVLDIIESFILNHERET